MFRDGLNGYAGTHDATLLKSYGNLDMYHVMTQFQSMGYAGINQAIADIAAQEPDVFAVDSTGASLRDGNHWNYAGLKTVTQRMVTITEQSLGL